MSSTLSPTAAPAPVPVTAGVVDLPAPVRGSLSPSRAGDFLTCPLLYRFRSIDRLPEPPSPAATRGTLVHSVLERLFDLPAAQRDPVAARALVAPEWERLLAAEPECAELFTGPDELTTWLASAGPLLDGYFTLEDPRRLEPSERELFVETLLPSGLLLRGYVDRLDVNAAGDVRVVDYKTGRSPGEAFEAKALFQMKFYALVLWRARGRIPRLLQLMYLGDKEVLRYSPDEADLLATERKLEALWGAIERAMAEQDFRPRRSALCGWCAHQSLCPEFGGTPPPFPALPSPSAPPASRRAAPVDVGAAQATAVTARPTAVAARPTAVTAPDPG